MYSINFSKMPNTLKPVISNPTFSTTPASSSLINLDKIPADHVESQISGYSSTFSMIPNTLKREISIPTFSTTPDSSSLINRDRMDPRRPSRVSGKPRMYSVTFSKMPNTLSSSQAMDSQRGLFAPSDSVRICSCSGSRI